MTRSSYLLSRAALVIGLALTAAVPTFAETYGVPDSAPSRVTVTATEASWVRVRDADGKVWTRTLAAGDSYRVPDHSGATLETGNVKALHVSLDGTDKPFVGTVGHSIVQHDLSLDPAKLGGASSQQVADAAPIRKQAPPQPIAPVSVSPAPAVTAAAAAPPTPVIPARVATAAVAPAPAPATAAPATAAPAAAPPAPVVLAEAAEPAPIAAVSTKPAPVAVAAVPATPGPVAPAAPVVPAPAPAAPAPAAAPPAPVVLASAAEPAPVATVSTKPAPLAVAAAPAPPVPVIAAPIVSPSPVPAQVQMPRPRPTRVDTTQGETDQKGLELEIGKGTVIQLRHAASTVFISNPAIADVQVKSPTLIYVMAKAPGDTTLIASDAGDHVLMQSPVRVTLNLSRLRTTLAQLLPGEPIRVDSIEGAIVLTGSVSSASQSADAQAIAGLFANQQAQQQGQASQSSSNPSGSVQLNMQTSTSMSPTGGNGQSGQGSQGGQGSQNAPSTPPTVINRLAVLAPNQVNLRVRVAEVARTTLRELGVNWSRPAGAGGNYIISTDNPVLLPNQFEQNLLQLGLFGSHGNALSAQLDAMAQEGLITTLAEPNLSAMSGQTASFLAGGEFPIPVATATSNGIPTVTIEFKKYGVAIDFVPTILDGHHINLRIRSEVSQLTQQGAIQSDGITIPAIQVRRAETSVELGSGDSFAMAGLLQNNGEHDISKIPALGDLPILGPLFRSDRYQRQETELVILVTPYLVQPTAVAASPMDGLARPDDLSREVTGAPYVQSPAGSPSRGGEQVLVGPAGFQLN